MSEGCWFFTLKVIKPAYRNRDFPIRWFQPYTLSGPSHKLSISLQRPKIKQLATLFCETLRVWLKKVVLFFIILTICAFDQITYNTSHVISCQLLWCADLMSFVSASSETVVSEDIWTQFVKMDIFKSDCKLRHPEMCRYYSKCTIVNWENIINASINWEQWKLQEEREVKIDNRLTWKSILSKRKCN